MLGHSAKSLLNTAHDKAIFGRRVAVLSRRLAAAIPGAGRVLDLGCGDGQIALGIMGHRADLLIEGVDVLVRPKTHIPVTPYDGRTLPWADKSFDYVTIVDVLHHTDDPGAVLVEAARVARHGVIVKDHLREGMLAAQTLRVMDWVGNRGHDVRLPYNYLSLAEWSSTFERAGLVGQSLDDRLGLYPAPLSWLFERDLHFIALLTPASP